MLLPVEGHRIGELARLRASYDQFQPFIERYEYSTAALGLVGSVGFLGLLGLVMFGRRREHPGLREGLGVLNLAAVLLATTGGFGMLFGLLVTPWIRAYNRMSVVIAFLALTAVVLGLSKLVRAARTARARWFVRVGLAGILILGLLDQTTRRFVPNYASIKLAADADTTFIGRVEAMLPAGSQVYQLPLVRFPEAAAPGSIAPYESLRPYLHSQSLRWSFGAMKGRYASAWQEAVATQPVDAMVRTLAHAEFLGILVDRAGYADRGVALVDELRHRLTTIPIESPDGRYAFFNMMAYVATLRNGMSPEAWQEARTSDLSPVVASWVSGFYPRDGQTGERSNIWSNGRSELCLLNPTDRPRRIVLSMTLSTLPDAPASVRITGPEGASDYRVDSRGQVFETTLTVPPGRVVLGFTHKGRLSLRPGDPGPLAFRVDRLMLFESDLAPLAQAAEHRTETRR
jgi:phosphoglycerol transferase